MTTIESVSNSLTELIKSRFPHSHLHIGVSTLGSASRPSICVSFALGKDNSEWFNGIIHNDRAHTVFLIHSKKSADGSLCDLTLDGGIVGFRGSNYTVDKCNWRDIKSPCDIVKVMKNLTKYFDSLLTASNNLNCGK